jgi:hypothetical protein
MRAMRGSRTPSVRSLPSDSQKAFQTLSRGRRVKLAKAAKTTLVKADQWARGDAVTAEIAGALDQALKALHAKGAKKKKA